MPGSNPSHNEKQPPAKRTNLSLIARFEQVKGSFYSALRPDYGIGTPYRYRENQLIILIVLFSAAMIVIFPRVFYNDLSDTSSPIDLGWMWAFNFFVAHKEHYQWGKDVVYTYGPLGFLSSRTTPNSYWLLQFLFDMYLVSNYVIVMTLLVKTRQKFRTVLLFCIVLLTATWEVNFLLEIFALFVLYFIRSEKKYYGLAYLAVLNFAMMLFIKLHTFPVILFSMGLLCFLLVKDKKYFTALGALFLFAGITCLLVYFFNVSVPDYISSTIDIIRHYSYSSYAFNPAYKVILYTGIVLSILTLLFIGYAVVFYLIPQKAFFEVLLIGNIGLMVLLLFKEGFTRLDRGHYNQFLCLFPLLLFVLSLLLPAFQKQLGMFTLGSIACTLFFSFVLIVKHYSGNIPLFEGSMPIGKYISQLFYLARQTGAGDIGHYSGGSYDYYSNQCINGKTNKNINWHNRPAFQSIVATSEEADATDARYYTGVNAPDTIYYDRLSADNRNPLWDDPQCKWVIFSRYEYLYTDRLNELVLYKRRSPLHRADLLLVDTVIGFNEKIHLPVIEKGIITLKAVVNQNWKGMVRTALFQPPHINLLLTHGSDGINVLPAVDTFRYIPDLFNDQNLIVNYSAGLSPGLDNHDRNKSDIGLVTTFNSIEPNVQSFSFQTDMPSGISNKIRVLLYLTTLN